MKKYSVLIFIIFSFSCQKEKGLNISGHWHCYYQDRDGLITDRYFTLDSLSKNEFLVDKYSIFSNKIAKHNKEDKTIQFDAECGAGDFAYEFKNDTLFLENALGNKSIGLSCFKGCCVPKNDFFIGIDLKIELELPVLPNEIKESVVEFNRENIIPIFIGKPIDKFKDDYGTEEMIQIHDKYISEEILIKDLSLLRIQYGKNANFVFFKSNFREQEDIITRLDKKIIAMGFQESYFVFSNLERNEENPFSIVALSQISLIK